MAEYYDREKLYNEVWESPMTEVCKRYGVSDVALAKVCKKLRIPRPPVGYWAKKEAGKAPKKPKLYKMPNAPQVQIRELIVIKPKLATKAFEEAEELVRMTKNIVIPDDNPNYHPYVRNTRKAFKRSLKKNYSNMYNRISTSGEDVFDIDIGVDSLDRVSIILQTLCETALSYGFKVIKSEKRGACIKTLDEEVPFKITESAKKIKIPTDPNKYWAKDYDYIPTGILKLEINTDSFTMDDRKVWTDTKTKNIEEKLLEVMHQFIRASAWIKEWQARKEKREEEYRLEREKQAERALLIRADKERIAKLESGFKIWYYHRDMTEYVASVKAHYIAEHGEPDGDFAKWLEWAETYLDKMNPLNGEYPKYEI